MNELYLSHVEALRVAKLAQEVFPTLGKILRNVATKLEMKDREEKQQENGTFLSWDEQTLEHTNPCEVGRIALQAWVNVAPHLNVEPQIFEFERCIPR